MSVDISLLSSLTRISQSSISTKSRDVTASVLASSSYGSSLTKAQKKSLSSLEGYIKDNVKGDDATKMAKQITSLRVVMEMTNSFSPKRSSAYDMTSDRFDGINNQTSAVLGRFYNQLL